MISNLSNVYSGNIDTRLFLLGISGHDRPGVTAALTKILGIYRAQILDMGQAVIHDSLSLGILAEFPDTVDSRDALKDIVFEAHGLGITVDIKPISKQDYLEWVSNEGQPRYTVTLLGRTVEARQMAAVSAVIARHGLNIHTISRLSSRPPYEPEDRQRSCIELSLRGSPRSLNDLRADLMRMGSQLGCDIAFQTQGAFRRNRRLVCFDMDSTLIQAEVINELATEAGVGEQVAAITEEAMRGEIDFAESFKRRLSLLEGLPESALEKVAQRLVMTDGAERLISTLKVFGYKTAIISGGFSYFAQFVSEKLHFDHIHAHELEIVDGKLTGRYLGGIIDGPAKARILREIADKEGISIEQVIAIGDGANDIPMLNLAGLGIAFHAKPIVKERAQNAISTLGLDAVLYFLGLRDRDIKASLVE